MIPVTISVLLVDDHAFTLSGMQRSLQEAGGFDVVATTGRGVDAIRLGKRLAPDLAVLDYVLPDATGLEIAIELRRWVPRTRIALVTGGITAPAAELLSEAGVTGLFSKGDDIAGICAGLRRVAAGESLIADQLASLPDAAGNGPKLSPREIEVLMAIADGMTNSGIADALGISPKTVDSHRTSLMRKMGANSAPQLLVRAARLGLIDF